VDPRLHVLVTGGAGFIGSHLVETLVGSGHAVTVVDDLSRGHLRNLTEVKGDIRFIEGDVCDAGMLLKACQHQDAVVHLAAFSGVPYSVAHPVESFDRGPRATLCVLEAARVAKVERFLYASSSSVYGGEGPYPQEEGSALNPTSHYALGKVMGERYVRFYRQQHGLQTTSLRYFNVYGPRQRCAQHGPALVPAVMEAMEADHLVTVDGDGMQSRDWTYVGNVAALTEEVLWADSPPMVVNVASGKTHSVLEVLGHLGCTDYNLTGTPRPGDVRKTQGSPLLLESVVGHKLDMVPLASGLQVTKECWLNR